MKLSTYTRRRVVGRAAALTAALGLGGRLRAVAAQEATPTSDPLATWSAGQTAVINDAALYYEDHGDPNGKPVLLLHGDFANSEFWANQAPVLVAAGYRVIMLDNRAHGRSAWGDQPITYEQMALDALGLLDHLGIAKTNVVGWSGGAIVALDLAIHHPERLDRVVAYGANFTPDGAQYLPSDKNTPFERHIADYRRLSPEPWRFEELTETLFALYEVAPNYSEAEVRSISVPVLVLDGMEEELVKPEHTRHLAALMSGATLVLMPGTGHFAPSAKPQMFNRIVLDYLAGKAPGLATPAAEALLP